MHQPTEFVLLDVALLVNLLEQALLGRAQAAGKQWVVQLVGWSAFVQLFEPARILQRNFRQGTHGRVEGPYALPRLRRVERMAPVAKHLHQLLAQLRAGGVGE